MQMTNRVPDWLTPVAWTYIVLSLCAAAYIAADIYLRRRRQTTVAGELVWITAALYLGPFAIALYRDNSKPTAHHQPAGTQPTQPESAAIAGLPGGGASAVAHLIGVPLVIASGLTIAGIDLWVMIIVIGILAMLLLFAYERSAGSAWRPTMSAGAAATAAVLTVLAFDIGMGGWMLLLHFNEFMPPATDGSFWFLMQVGIVLGLVTGYPVVRWLHRSSLGPRHAART
ncbi:DUF4396 domain-containing protein [Nocardioides aurantiacus]|uniref:DUF4396 domain-containing protein n=1 Tax=Nocardioides aurantiacus TaxID=86796 RepID=UPI00403F8E80